jgi:hypothetical protein
MHPEVFDRHYALHDKGHDRPGANKIEHFQI